MHSPICSPEISRPILILRLLRYCEALNKNSGKPKKDDLTCKKEHNAKGPWGFDVAKFAYKYDGKDYKKAGKNKIGSWDAGLLNRRIRREGVGICLYRCLFLLEFRVIVICLSGIE